MVQRLLCLLVVRLIIQLIMRGNIQVQRATKKCAFAISGVAQIESLQENFYDVCDFNCSASFTLWTVTVEDKSMKLVEYSVMFPIY